MILKEDRLSHKVWKWGMVRDSLVARIESAQNRDQEVQTINTLLTYEKLEGYLHENSLPYNGECEINRLVIPRSMQLRDF